MYRIFVLLLLVVAVTGCASVPKKKNPAKGENVASPSKVSSYTLAATASASYIKTYTPPILDCRVTADEERRRYTDSIRFTYTLMDDLPMEYLFDVDAARAPTVLFIVQLWHDRLGGLNLYDYDTGLGNIKVQQLETDKQTQKLVNPWIPAFTNLENYLSTAKRSTGELYSTWKYRDLFLKMKAPEDVQLQNLFGVLSGYGMDLPFINPTSADGKVLLSDRSTFLNPDYCGKLDLRDFFTSCIGPPEPDPDAAFFAPIKEYAREAAIAGLLFKVNPFPLDSSRYAVTDEYYKEHGMMGLCCSQTTNKCISPSHDICTTCGSYCCLGSYMCD